MSNVARHYSREFVSCLHARDHKCNVGGYGEEMDSEPTPTECTERLAGNLRGWHSRIEAKRNITMAAIIFIVF